MKNRQKQPLLKEHYKPLCIGTFHKYRENKIENLITSHLLPEVPQIAFIQEIYLKNHKKIDYERRKRREKKHSPVLECTATVLKEKKNPTSAVSIYFI